MPIQDQSPSEQYVFGGVDSQSNPLNMPQDRALRCCNWVPNAGGWLELRRGYTPVASTLGSASDGSGNYSPPPPPPGYVMLDWMPMSAALRAANHLASTGLDGVTASNHLYTTVNAGNFYWTKGDSGFPWDIDPFDDTPTSTGLRATRASLGTSTPLTTPPATSIRGLRKTAGRTLVQRKDL